MQEFIKDYFLGFADRYASQGCQWKGQCQQMCVNIGFKDDH